MAPIVIQHHKGSGRGRGPDQLKPWRQGDLDGLCGIYSIINACGALCPELSRSDQRDLFDRLITHLCTSESIPYSAVANGMSRRMLSDLFKPARKYLRKQHDIRLSFDRLQKWQRRLVGDERTDELFNLLQDGLGPSCVAIVGLGGHYNHWTVVTGLTDKSLILSDSEAVTRIGRHRCTVELDPRRVVIETHCVIFVRRLDKPEPKTITHELELTQN